MTALTTSRPSWSPDGNWIYYTSTATGPWQIWKLPVDGGQAVQVTKHGGQNPFVSADGTTLYYISQDYAHVWQKRLPDGEERQFDEIPALLSWNGWQLASKGMYFAARGTPSELRVHPFGSRPRALVLLRYLDFATGAITTVTTLTLTLPGGIAVSSDARTVPTHKATRLVQRSCWFRFSLRHQPARVECSIVHASIDIASHRSSVGCLSPEIPK